MDLARSMSLEGIAQPPNLLDRALSRAGLGYLSVTLLTVTLHAGFPCLRPLDAYRNCDSRGVSSLRAADRSRSLIISALSQASSGVGVFFPLRCALRDWSASLPSCFALLSTPGSPDRSPFLFVILGHSIRAHVPCVAPQESPVLLLARRSGPSDPHAGSHRRPISMP